MDIIQAQYFLDVIEKEKKAENNATPFVHGTTFTDCLKTHHIDTERNINGNKIQAHTIYGLWDRYLIAVGEVEKEQKDTVTTKGGNKKTKPVIKPPMVFTDAADMHMQRMYNWLTTEYTERYKSITISEEQTWLKKIIRFVVLRRIMENKYEMWITTGKGFMDPEIGLRIAEIYRIKYVKPEIARLIHASIPPKHLTEDQIKQISQAVIEGVLDLLSQDPAQYLPEAKRKRFTLIEGGSAINE